MVEDTQLTERRRREALSLIVDRVIGTLDECAPQFPMYVDADGRWYTTEDGNWCAGHWIGLLWLASRWAPSKQARERFVASARGYITRFETQPLDNLFAGMNHYYAGFLGFDVTGDRSLRAVGIRGADAMLRLYDPVAEQIPVGRYEVAPGSPSSTDGSVSAWDATDRRHLAAVDAIHTSVPVLWRAYRETRDDRYYDVAAAHTRRHMSWHVRGNGSTTQLRPYDALTGAPGNASNTLANGPEGCWSRGQAWNIAGLATGYVATRDEILLEVLRKSVDYYLTQTQPRPVPLWDLTVNGRNAPSDSSAAAIVAYGLLQLSSVADTAGDLADVGEHVLATLIDECLVTAEGAADRGAVTHGCYRHPQGLAVDSELIWTDFYTACALDAWQPSRSGTAPRCAARSVGHSPRTDGMAAT